MSDLNRNSSPTTIERPEPAQDEQDGAREGTEQKPERRLDVSFSQVVGGALAAMTAAAIGSRLGVAGTIIGAALASVVASIAGSLYVSGIKRTRAGVKTAIHYATPKSRNGSRPNPAPLSRQEPSKVTLTESLSESAVAGRPTSVTLVEDDDQDLPAVSLPPKGGPTRRSRKRLIWGSVVGAVAVFVIALTGIAGYELVVGHSLDGQPGGTTVGRAVSGGSSKQHKSDPSNDSDSKKSDSSDKSGNDGKSDSTGQDDGKQQDDPSSTASDSSEDPSGQASADSGTNSDGGSTTTDGSGSDSSNTGTDNGGADGSSDSNTGSDSNTDSGTDSGVAGGKDSQSSTDGGSGSQDSGNSLSDSGSNSDSGTSGSGS